MQTKLESFTETFLNIGSGMILAWILTIYILPLWGFIPDIRQAFEITCFYTVVSLIRSYFWRRIFNKRSK